MQPTGGVGRIFHAGGNRSAFPLGNVALAPAADAGRWAASTRNASSFGMPLSLLREHTFCASQQPKQLRAVAPYAEKRSKRLRAVTSCAEKQSKPLREAASCVEKQSKRFREAASCVEKQSKPLRAVASGITRRAVSAVVSPYDCMTDSVIQS
jgi:hypothetical protein